MHHLSPYRREHEWAIWRDAHQQSCQPAEWEDFGLAGGQIVPPTKPPTGRFSRPPRVEYVYNMLYISAVNIYGLYMYVHRTDEGGRRVGSVGMAPLHERGSDQRWREGDAIQHLLCVTNGQMHRTKASNRRLDCTGPATGRWRLDKAHRAHPAKRESLGDIVAAMIRGPTTDYRYLSRRVGAMN